MLYKQCYEMELTMSPNEAKSIIEALANGLDPETGEVLPEQTILNQPKIIRALFFATQVLDNLSKEKNPGNAVADLSKKAKREKTRLGNAGKGWTNTEDNVLLSSFNGGVPVKDIAARHGRSIGAIAARLVRLGCVNERKDVYFKA